MSRERRNDIIQTPQKSTPQTCRTSTSCAEDSLVRHFQSLAEEGALTIPAALSSLKLPDWLNPNDLRIFCSKTFRDCCRMTKAGRFLSSSPRLMTWGTAWNGWCLTANILESRNPEGGCSLSAILIPDAPEKYFPVFGTGGKALIQVLGGSQGSRVYDADGIACTQTAGAGGVGGKTGLYLVGFNRKDGIVGKRDTAISLNASDFRGINRNQTQNAVLIDLCSGHPKQTDTARCLTARYGQTTLSNHRAERSGVLLIKEATKKGYKEANPGDSVDLGFSGSNTRRGRVGQDIAHTLETSCIQGIVECGGRIRRLMPRECLRLQGFDEWQIDRILAIQSDAQAYKQAGNSVTANVIEAIGRRIREVDAELKAGAAA